MSVQNSAGRLGRVIGFNEDGTFVQVEWADGSTTVEDFNELTEED